MLFLVLENILIGLITSTVSGTAVWMWRRAHDRRTLAGQGEMFGLKPSGCCLIVVNHHWQKSGSTSHNDVLALVSVASLAQRLGNVISVLPDDESRERHGSCSEICIGGPRSNARTEAHLATALPGVIVRPLSNRRDSSAFIVAGNRHLLDHGKVDHALVARFPAGEAKHPVLLVCGQSAIANRAAVAYLMDNHRSLAQHVADVDRFCLLLRVESAKTFGVEATSLVADVTDAAFRPPAPPALVAPVSSAAPG